MHNNKILGQVRPEQSPAEPKISVPKKVFGPMSLNEYLVHSAEHGNIDGVAKALADGADIDFSIDRAGSFEGTAIYWAALRRDERLIALLQEKGVNRSLYDEAIHFADEFSSSISNAREEMRVPVEQYKCGCHDVLLREIEKPKLSIDEMIENAEILRLGKESIQDLDLAAKYYLRVKALKPDFIHPQLEDVLNDKPELDSAVSLYEQKQYDSAHQKFISLAQKGYATALHYLGLINSMFKTASSNQQSFLYFRESSELGNKQSTWVLVNIFEKGLLGMRVNLRIRGVMLEILCAHGDAKATLMLAQYNESQYPDAFNCYMYEKAFDLGEGSIKQAAYEHIQRIKARECSDGALRLEEGGAGRKRSSSSGEPKCKKRL